MVHLIFSNVVKEFSDDVLKISTYLKELAKDRSEIDEPIPLIETNEKIFEIFELWFKELSKQKIVEINLNVHFSKFAMQHYKLTQNDINEYAKNISIVFKPKLFKKYDLDLLIEIFNFALNNQIKLLCDTIAYVISQKIEHIYTNDGKYFLLGDAIVDGMLKLKEIHYTLMFMILKNMTDKKFDKQEPEIKKLCCSKLEREFLTFDYNEYINNILVKCGDTSNGKKWFFVVMDPNKDLEELKRSESRIIMPCCKKIRRREFRFDNTLLYVPDEVEKIEDSAFSYCNLVQLFVGYGKLIQDEAFSNCNQVIINDVLTQLNTNKISKLAKVADISAIRNKKITSLTFPETFEKIESEFVNGLNSLTKVTIKNPNIIIEPKAFKNCRSLNEFVIESDTNPTSKIYNQISPEMFVNCPLLEIINGDTLCKGISRSNHTYTNITNIKPHAFNNVRIETLNLSKCNNLTEIGARAFENSEIEHIILPNSIKKICYKAFKNCKLLNLIKIGNNCSNNLSSVTEIEYGAFEGCVNISKLIINNNTDIQKIFGGSIVNSMELTDDELMNDQIENTENIVKRVVEDFEFSW